MKVGIIGASGLVGRAIYERLKEEHSVSSITRHTYPMHKGGEYDILINANGNSRKYWANQNPLGDYNASVQTVAESLFDFKYKKYIFISSIDAEEPRGHYGFNKRIAEDLVKQYADKWQIVRLCSVIGKNMNKGPVYDIKHCKPLYLTSGSTLQLITAKAVAAGIEDCMVQGTNHHLWFYSPDSISIREIAKIMGKPLTVHSEAIEEKYSYYHRPGAFKTSEQYLMEMS